MKTKNKNTEQKIEGRGEKLMSWLNDKAVEKGLSKSELAKELGVSMGYLSQLQSGEEKMIKNVGEDFINKATEFLKASRLSVLVAANKINDRDFYQLNENEYIDEIESAITYILKDKKIGTIIPAEIQNADFKIKEMTVRLFEKITEKKLIGSKIDLNEFFLSNK